jgi:hypothetical protein
LGKDDIKSLSLVSTEIRKFLLKTLWASIAVTLTDDFHMDDATRSTFPQEASMKTSQLHFGPESGQERHLFCPHLYTMRRHLGWRLDMDEGEERFENMEYKGVSVIKLFMPRKIKSFR